MLESVRISRRQSEIRQELATLAAKAEPSEDEVRAMDTLDKEYRTAEVRFRAALVSEDTERRDAKGELETRGDRQWSDLVQRFELRQVALALDEGRKLDGATAEVVEELRSSGGYRGYPIPLESLVLERRAGETIASGTPNPIATMPIIDRLFADSAALRMGAQLISIPQGEVEFPVATSGATVAWQQTETGNVGGPSAYATTDRPLKPDNTLGVQMKLTRKALKQSGASLEQAVRRDMAGAMQQAIDKAIFLGAGASGEPSGVISKASAYGIAETSVGAEPSWAIFRKAVVRFMLSNAVSAPTQVRAMFRPEVWDDLDTFRAGDGYPIWEMDRVVAAMGAGNITLSTNALAAPAGDPLATSALLTTTAGGVAPIFVGLWGAIDLIRDPYSDAQSGGLRVTALATMDVTISRSAQLEVLTNIKRFVAT
jgi:HK97 family phage major capsid protein